MSIPYSSTTNLPQGFESVTINLVPYIVDACSGASKENRVITRTDANGDRADFMIRAGSDQIEVSYTLQRATDTTVLPQEGQTFTHDYDRSGTASTLVVKDVTVARDKDAFDTFEMTAVLVTYQS
ncbi:hypothetical protein P8625_16 [Verrucomicrobia phage P8625]|uniref:hypothetical protein n=1 Tax=Verrucomicrobia phage P8625 TaxID=1636271 RepID=UPI0005FEB3E3|nr:hypothetical protein AWI59_gp16 [Verrucomicrobia phage P8625]AKA60267.1 hypothetical protein P8625_16 [Verrucomicrobia phage P8625]